MTRSTHDPHPAEHLVVHEVGLNTADDEVQLGSRELHHVDPVLRQQAGIETAITIVSELTEFTTVSTSDEVREIFELQAANLPAALTPETMVSQGFVTVRHDLPVLLRMNEVAPAIVAKAGGRVVGYALVMLRDFAPFVPILRPLFVTLETLSWNGVLLSANPRWFVMGQICVADGYRGMGIFDGLYRAMAEQYRDRFDFTVTEVAARNRRSLRAHARVGFQTLHVYPDATTGQAWHVIVLNLGAVKLTPCTTLS